MINSVLIKMSPKTIYYYTSANNLDSFRLIIRSASCHHLLYWHQTWQVWLQSFNQSASKFQNRHPRFVPHKQNIQSKLQLLPSKSRLISRLVNRLVIRMKEVNKSYTTQKFPSTHMRLMKNSDLVTFSDLWLKDS